jgi:hypothetical protein
LRMPLLAWGLGPVGPRHRRAAHGTLLTERVSAFVSDHDALNQGMAHHVDVGELGERNAIDWT